jgi:hypothetical protein
MTFHRFHPNPEIQRKLDRGHQLRADFLRKCSRSFKLWVASCFRDHAAIDPIPHGTDPYQKQQP